MKSRLFCIFLILIFRTGSLLGQQPISDQILFTIEDESISAEEFLYVFNKNRLGDSAVTRSDIADYLDLFVKFKLKVRAARELGIDTTQAYLTELAGYQEQLVKPYLQDEEFTDQLVREAYNR